MVCTKDKLTTTVDHILDTNKKLPYLYRSKISIKVHIDGYCPIHGADSCISSNYEFSFFFCKCISFYYFFLRFLELLLQYK